MSKTKQIRLDPHTAKLFGLEIKPNEDGRSTARYRVSLELAKEIEIYRMQPKERQFKVVIKKFGKNGELLSTTEKLQSEPMPVPDDHIVVRTSTNTTSNQQWVITEIKDKRDSISEIDFESIIKKHIKPVRVPRPKSIKKTVDFQVLTISDVHIGLHPNKKKNSMYPSKWNESEIMAEAKFIVDFIKKNVRSKTLYIDDLGDFMDGLNEKTLRGGHRLPQSMENFEAFDCAVAFKMYIIDNLVHLFDRIFLNNVCNDNHSGDFAYFVNSTIKHIAELKYKRVKVINYRQFISHYFAGDICFLICHGKDEEEMKHGLGVVLKDSIKDKIDHYCKKKGIYKKAKLIIFKKGDSHQALFDMCNSADFYFFNYPALSPPSNHINTNYTNSRKGFFLEDYKGLIPIIHPVFTS